MQGYKQHFYEFFCPFQFLPACTNVCVSWVFHAVHQVRINLEDYPQLPQKTVRLGAPWVSLATTVRELHELLFSRICRQTDAGTISIDPAWVKGADNSEIYGRCVFSGWRVRVWLGVFMGV
jgi:hypothetical protein